MKFSLAEWAALILTAAVVLFLAGWCCKSAVETSRYDVSVEHPAAGTQGGETG